MAENKQRNTEFKTVAVTEPARAALRAATAWAIGLSGVKLSAGDAMRAMLQVAQRHPDEVRAAIAGLGDSTEDHSAESAARTDGG